MKEQQKLKKLFKSDSRIEEIFDLTKWTYKVLPCFIPVLDIGKTQGKNFKFDRGDVFYLKDNDNLLIQIQEILGDRYRVHFYEDHVEINSILLNKYKLVLLLIGGRL